MYNMYVRIIQPESSGEETPKPSPDKKTKACTVKRRGACYVTPDVSYEKGREPEKKIKCKNEGGGGEWQTR